MHVAAIHRISDPESFNRVVNSAMEAGPPDGFSLPYQFTAEDGRTQICVWEAPSVEAVRELVDSSVGEFAKNEVFTVDRANVLIRRLVVSSAVVSEDWRSTSRPS
jgi:hypothetical protein